ncbi:peptide deformylase [Yinghuangia sp. ASG 101]|uniref:peptide deformylase n=1 Tax=Yinghuangia sp. ASG 101 TaxID=2896848 RepID=UPI001E3C51F4|nr:peptide deformylase [Yinghuangia sp. ASG 101]UGQ13903.1 peptide deformylase [Yinghuangia sp. ASG 101]
MSEPHNHTSSRTGARIFVQGQPVDSYPDFAPGTERAETLRITVVGEDVLHHPCAEITEFGTPELEKLIDDMFRTMYVADGVGLAANQVGVGIRLFVYDCTDEDGNRHVGHILNPVIDELPASERHLEEAGEGCLSVPGPNKDLARPDRAIARGVDKDGNPLVIEGTGYFARCLQHETDHLNGYLYIDRLSKRDRKDALKKMESMRESVFARRAEKDAQIAG